jgi:hypothetical protein
MSGLVRRDVTARTQCTRQDLLVDHHLFEVDDDLELPVLRAVKMLILLQAELAPIVRDRVVLAVTVHFTEQLMPFVNPGQGVQCRAFFGAIIRNRVQDAERQKLAAVNRTGFLRFQAV